MSFIRQAGNLVPESTVINCFKAARFNGQGLLQNFPNEANDYEDRDEKTAIYNN